MTSKQYTLIVAVIVIVVLGLFFIITSRNSDITVENPNTTNPLSTVASSSDNNQTGATSTLNASTTLIVQ